MDVRIASYLPVTANSGSARIAAPQGVQQRQFQPVQPVQAITASPNQQTDTGTQRTAQGNPSGPGQIVDIYV